MLLFAHLGITLGTAVVIAGVNDQLKTTGSTDKDSVNENGITGMLKAVPGIVSSWLEGLARLVDIRALLIGSLLPDIIDKPVGHWLLADSLNNGRIFSHSLVFLLLIALSGLLIYRRYKNSFFLVISLGVFIHLIMDSMWLSPHSFLWPFLGFAFDKGDTGNFFLELLESLESMNTFIPELIGFLILCGFGFWLLKREHYSAF